MALQKINNISSPEEINSIAYADITKIGGIDVVHGFVPSGSPLAWYSADSIVGLSDGDPVSTWPDRTANGFDLTAATTDRPTYKTGIQNTLPAVRFDGTDNWMTNTAIGARSQPITIFIVYAQTVYGGYATMISGGAGSAIFWLWNFIGQPNMRLAGPDEVLTDKSHPGTMSYVTARWSGATSFVRVGGVQSAAVDPGSGDITGLILGSETGGSSRFFKGDICEVIMYAGAEDPTANEAGLITKWGL